MALIRVTKTCTANTDNISFITIAHPNKNDWRIYFIGINGKYLSNKFNSLEKCIEVYNAMLNNIHAKAYIDISNFGTEVNEDY